MVLKSNDFLGIFLLGGTLRFLDSNTFTRATSGRTLDLAALRDLRLLALKDGPPVEKTGGEGLLPA